MKFDVFLNSNSPKSLRKKTGSVDLYQEGNMNINHAFLANL